MAKLNAKLDIVATARRLSVGMPSGSARALIVWAGQLENAILTGFADRKMRDRFRDDLEEQLKHNNLRPERAVLKRALRWLDIIELTDNTMDKAVSAFELVKFGLKIEGDVLHVVLDPTQHEPREAALITRYIEHRVNEHLETIAAESLAEADPEEVHHIASHAYAAAYYAMRTMRELDPKGYRELLSTAMELTDVFFRKETLH